MSARLPRTPLLGGRVVAVGVWIDPTLVGELEARRRVLELLDPRARVHEVDDGLLVLFGAPRVLHAEVAPGTVLVRLDGGGFASCELSTAERTHTPCEQGQWLRARGGRLEAVVVQAAPSVDVSAWIDVGPWTVSRAWAFGPPPEPVVARVRGVAEDAKTSVRELLGGKAPVEAAERAALLDALAKSGRGVAVGDAESGWRGWLSRFFATDRPRAGYPVLPGEAPSTSSAPATPPEPGLLERLYRRFVERSPLSAIIGRKQAEYLQRTLAMFDRGDLDEALRHAIPFSSLPGAPTPPSLSVPSPRSTLDLRAVPGPAASSSLNLGDSLYHRFKALYRDAAERLEAQGRIEEAAYVYFELLGEENEGIAVFERHGLYELAASMAHGRGMNPALVIRLWFLAKQPGKAILVAKRTGAFADAIARLEASSPEDALHLRLIWADRLAQSGQYEAAVQAIWPAEQGRALARAWMDRSIAFGGPSGARMLARKLSLWRDHADVVAEVEESLATLVARDDDDAVVQRRAFAESWVEHFSPRSKVRPMLGALVRRMMLDGEAELVLQLVDRKVDPVLAADIAHAMRPEAAQERSNPPHSRAFGPHERGLLVPTDAVMLPNHRFIVAVGEAGLRLVDARGNTLRSYHTPASTLVLADSGRRLITLHRRGKRVQLCRVDLETGGLQPWAETRLDRWARSYDGATWYVSVADRVLAIDAQAPGFEALWSVGGLPSECLGIGLSPTYMCFATAGETATPWIWKYELSRTGPVLRGKADGPEPFSENFVVGTNGTAACWVPSEQPHQPLLVARTPEGRTEARKVSSPLALEVWDHGVVYASRTSSGVAVYGLGKELAQVWDLEFHGSESVGVHPIGDHCVVFDALGRLVVVDAVGTIKDIVTTRA